MIGVIDTCLSNINSVLNALQKIDQKAKTLSEPNDFDSCEGFIFPGIGSWDELEKSINSELIKKIKETKRPFLGICLGMQFLFEASDEGKKQGLGIIPGVVSSLEIRTVPHMGWNNVTFEVRDPLFEGISNDSDFYFVHSFAQKSGRFAIGTTNVEDTIFTSVVNKENFYGVQFHPEKSGENGLKLLKNFASMT